MKFWWLLIILPIAVLSAGCAPTCNPIIKTEYQEVQVPTVYKLKRPDRPNLMKCESVPSCIQDLISYTTNLEYIIDGSQK